MSNTSPLYSFIQAWRDFWLRRRLCRAMKMYAVRRFGPHQSKAVLNELAACSFPMLESNATESVRVKIAILILSKGQKDLFQVQLKAALSDWRDVLIAAGMAVVNWRDVVRNKGVEIH